MEFWRIRCARPPRPGVVAAVERYTPTVSKASKALAKVKARWSA